mmetsp:Transcript_11168/g.20228  ORF Transcript_11168/g.20228 Transcript_11168/m.20228 type:complete len:225 (-) Transcript_11168:8-682(-)
MPKFSLFACGLKKALGFTGLPPVLFCSCFITLPLLLSPKTFLEASFFRCTILRPPVTGRPPLLLLSLLSLLALGGVRELTTPSVLGPSPEFPILISLKSRGSGSTPSSSGTPTSSSSCSPVFLNTALRCSSANTLSFCACSTLALSSSTMACNLLTNAFCSRISLSAFSALCLASSFSASASSFWACRLVMKSSMSFLLCAMPMTLLSSAPSLSPTGAFSSKPF